MGIETRDAWSLYDEVMASGLVEHPVPDHNYECKHIHMEADTKSGDYVCIDCGHVSHNDPVYVISINESYVAFGWGPSSSGSTYKRTHYYNERINQWTCRDANFNIMELEAIKDFLPRRESSPRRR